MGVVFVIRIDVEKCFENPDGNWDLQWGEPNVFFAKDMLTFCETFPEPYFALESANFS